MSTTSKDEELSQELLSHFISWEGIEKRWNEGLRRGSRFGYMYLDLWDREMYYDFTVVAPDEDVFDHITKNTNDHYYSIPEVFILDYDLKEQRAMQYYADTSGKEPKTLRGTKIPWPVTEPVPIEPAFLLPDREAIMTAGKVAIDNKSKFLVVIRNDWLYQDWYVVAIPPVYSIYNLIPAIHGVLESFVVGVYNPNLPLDVQIEKIRFVGREPIPETPPYEQDEKQLRLRMLLSLFLIYVTADNRILEVKYFWNLAWEMISSLPPEDLTWAIPQLQKLILVASVMQTDIPDEALAFTGIDISKDWKSPQADDTCRDTLMGRASRLQDDIN